MLKHLFSPLALLCFIVLGFSACGDDDDQPNNPIIGTITDQVTDPDNAQFSVLAGALERTGLDEVLDRATSRFTVFAPTDEAFANSGLDIGSFSDEQLRNVLLYHVISDNVLRAVEITDGDTELGSSNVTGPGDAALPLNLNNAGGTLSVGGTFSTVTASVTSEDIEAVNGVIYTIDNVLLPPTIADRATLDGRFTTLLSLLERVGLDETIMGEGTFTVFAPTDDAFANADINPAVLTDDQVRALLLYHVLGSEVTAGDIPDGNSFATTLSQGGPDSTMLSLFIDNSDNVTINGDAEVIETDFIGSNGVVHAIDQVLSYQDVADFIVLSDMTSMLEDLLVQENLTTTLMTDGPFTVFGPTNDALTAAADTLMVLDSLMKVDSVLLYHVVVGDNIRSDEFMDSTFVEGALMDQSFLVRVDTTGGGNTPSIFTRDSTTVNFNMTDIQGTNGVLHLIDGVLLPELEE